MLNDDFFRGLAPVHTAYLDDATITVEADEFWAWAVENEHNEIVLRDETVKVGRLYFEDYIADDKLIKEFHDEKTKNDPRR